MSILEALELVWLMMILPLIAAIFLGRPIWVMVTQRPSDFSTIKAAYEGLTSRVAPHSKVVSIERAGTLVSRSALARRYTVVLEKANGLTVSKTVYVDASLLGEGGVSE